MTICLATCRGTLVLVHVELIDSSQVARSYRFSNFESFSMTGAFQGGRIDCGYSIVICIDSSS